MNIIPSMALMSWFWIIWLIFLIYCILFVQWQMHKSSRSLKAFRSFPRFPLIGSLYLVIGDMRTRVQKLLGLMNYVRKPTVFWFSYIPVIILSKSELIQQTLHRNQDRDVLGVFESIFEDGMLLAKGDQWRYIRRIMNQAFTTPMLKQYLRVFNEQSNIMVKRLEEKANTGIHFDLHQYAIDMNIDVITKNMMDYDLKTQEKGNNEFSSALVRSLAVESKRLTNPILFFKIFFNIYLYLTDNKKWYSITKKLPEKIVKEKVNEYNKKKGDGTTEEKPDKTLMDIFLKIHNQQPEFDEHRMSVEILTMISTGSDTTATTISCVCLMLAMYPEIQEKVYQEILSVFKDKDFVEVKMEHCNELRYMEQCIKETLRRFSLIPLTFRQCCESIKLNDEQIIPANCKVGFAFHAIHQDPTIYPDPDKFDPDRFSPENCAINAQHFMGFGIGHRACIGTKYAMLSMKTQLVHILRKYKLTTDLCITDIIYIMDITSRFENGYPVQFWFR